MNTEGVSTTIDALAASQPSSHTCLIYHFPRMQSGSPRQEKRLSHTVQPRVSKSPSSRQYALDDKSEASCFQPDAVDPLSTRNVAPILGANESQLGPDKPTSPSHSSGATTGTTGTPTSVGNTSSGTSLGTEAKDRAPNPQGSASLRQMLPRYESSPDSQAPIVDYASGGPLHQQQNDSLKQDSTVAAIKLLVSNNVAGSIIGRAGQTISDIQQQSSTRIKLSQTGDYYPGTQDRVCLVQGDILQVKIALRLLLERLYMLQEHHNSQNTAWQLQRQRGEVGSAFDFVVRLLVPSSCCGMIIGKAGSNIKLMEEATRVLSVRLSPKDSGETGISSAAVIAATSERAVTITGQGFDSCLQCLTLIVEGMVSHPDISRYANMTTSYKRLIPEIAGYTPPLGNRPLIIPAGPVSPRHSPEHGLPLVGFDASIEIEARRIASSPNLPGGTPNNRMSDYALEKRLAPYNSGLFGATTRTPNLPSPVGPPLYMVPHPGSDNSPETGLQHNTSDPDLLAAQLEQSMQFSPNLPRPYPPAADLDYGGTLVPQTPTMTAPGCFQAQVLVPDSMIGSILGRAGRTLNELQILSGTGIRISQRGEYMPGTRARVVTIRGPSAQSVWQAQYMMSQRMVLPPTAYPPPPSNYFDHSLSGANSHSAP